MRQELEKTKKGDSENSAENMDAAVERSEKAETAQKDKNGDAMEIEESETNKKLGSFERINNAVEGLLEPPQKTVRKSSKRKSDTGRKADAEDATLTASQLEAIDFIEKKWGNSHRPGAILTGPKSSGKTTALSSLLWKHRAKGPQLLVCSPARVVSLFWNNIYV
jgi:primosomal protein N'